MEVREAPVWRKLLDAAGRKPGTSHVHKKHGVGVRGRCGAGL